MHLLFFLSAVIVSVSGGFLPKYDDPIHGKLVVSRRNPPFLTLEEHPERELYLPTDQQVKEIRSAVYGGFNLFHREWVSNSTSDVIQLRLKRSIDGNDDEGESNDQLTLSSEAFEKGMKTFNHYSKYVGKMIIRMFKAYIDKEPMPDPKIPFKSFEEKTYFKAAIIPIGQITTWLCDLRKTMELHAKERPYFPIEKVLSELKECRSVGFSQVADKDFKFESEEGGRMNYYQVQCQKIENEMFVFMALNDNNFKLKPEQIEFVDNCEKSHVDEKDCEMSCWVREQSPKFAKCPSAHGQTDKVMTAAQQRELNDYLIDKVVQRVKIDFQDKIDAGKGQFLS